MIATISAQPIRMSYHQHHYANASGGPLPIIPRRASTTRQTASSTAPASQPPKRTSNMPSVMSIKRSSSSNSDSDSGSNASSSTGRAPVSLRARRARGPHPPTFPPELSTHIPNREAPETQKSEGLRASKTEDNITFSTKKAPPHPMLYTPGMPLRFGMDSSNRTPSADRSKSLPGRAADDSRLIRKKSGQLVKSSLKTSKSTGRDGFSVFTSSHSTKSEPATPVCKAVHFDSQLEHVKLFLAEQKPLAVSRDGSPTDDTSGTDSDFPSFIFGERDDKRARRKITIDVVNMPPRVNHCANVILEDLAVSADNASILGRVSVRNIAYAKTVAVRFTFDSWQTTSEVIGKYAQSITAEFDRFCFTIKLDDLLARIEEKTLILAVRYSVAGQEFWDNNNSLNYVAKFNRSTIRERSLSDDEDPSNLASLQNKLEQVVQGKERTGPAFLTQSPRSSVEPEEPSFKSTSSLASRYDFSASLKSSWKYHESPPSHHRNNSYPQYPQFAKPSTPPSSVIPTKSMLFDKTPFKPAPLKGVPNLGSPRDLSEGAIPTTPTTALTEDVPFEVPLPPYRETHIGPRNHHRGYFDLTTFTATSLKRTPPATPVLQTPADGDALFGSAQPHPTSPFGSKFYSFPPGDSVKSGLPPSPVEFDRYQHPVLNPLDVGMNSLERQSASGLFVDTGFDSELSTPSLATPTSRSPTPSPTERFLNLPDDDPTRSDTHYRELINQYCFFTGGTTSSESGSDTDSNTTAVTNPFDFRFRYKSTSDSEYVMTSSSSTGSVSTPRLQGKAQMSSEGSPTVTTPPSRSSSLDDVSSIRSGSLTPTISRLGMREWVWDESQSRSPTPVSHLL